MYKVKITLLKNDNELDSIIREIPSSDKYNVVTGLLHDLYLLIRRNFNYDNNYIWLLDQLYYKIGI